MSLEKIHPGPLYIINEAAKLGKLTVGLLSDKAIASYKRIPDLSFDERKEILNNIKGVDNIIIQDSIHYTKNLKKLKPSYVVHGDHWRNGPLDHIRKEIISTLNQWGGRLIEIPYKEKKQAFLLKKSSIFIGTTVDMRRAKLKRLIESKELVRVLETHSPLSALIVENINLKIDDNVKEFDAMWSSSLTDSTLRGKPDIEAVDSSSRIQTINNIFEVTTKPLIYDADTGGKIEHFSMVIKNLERLGVSAAIVEDKVGLKRNSLFGNEVKQEQDTIDNFCEKISVAKQSQVTNDFMLIARIESLILEKGNDDAINRAKEYIDAGADGIMIHSRKSSPNEIIEFTKSYNKFIKRVPLVSVPSSYNSIKEPELIDIGINLVIYANHMLRASYPAMYNVADKILKNERSLEADNDLMSINEILSLIPNK